jgi:hypothetical protein
MRNHPKSVMRLVFSSVLAIAAPASAMNWQEGMDPAILRGSFYSTCSECRVDANGHLSCRCVNNAGRIARQTSVALGYCNRVGPNNANGVLNCQPIVRGSWAQSCLGAYISGNALYAGCRNRAGELGQTVFPLDRCPSMNLANIDGHLRCYP